MRTDDLRVIKTRHAIKSAFFKLMKQKSFEKITVADITNLASINRGTFYSHYRDKYDLLEKIETDILTDMSKFISLITADALEKINISKEPLPHIVPMMAYIENNPDYFMILLETGNSLQFIQKVLSTYFDHVTGNFDMKSIDLWKEEYIRDFIIAFAGSIINRWLIRGMAEDKEMMANWITEIAYPHIAKYQML